jgi:ATP-dependent Clp protease ATP-binding subunit ClpA
MGPALGFLGPAAAEARALGHNYIGTEHLLIALLARPSGAAAVALRRLGVGRDEVHDRLLGKLASPPKPRVDAEALTTLGIDLDRVRGRIEEAFGPGALEQAGAGCMSVSPRTKLALAYAVEEARCETVGDNHVLIGLLCVERSLAAGVLAEFGVSLGDVRVALGG